MAHLAIKADIARDFGCNLRRTRSTRGGCGRNRAQWSIVHGYLLGRVERFGSGLRHNERERLTDVAELVDGPQWLRRERERCARLYVDFHGRPHRPKPI